MVVNEKNQLGIEIQSDEFKLSWFEDTIKDQIAKIPVNGGMSLKDIMRYQLVFLGDDSVLKDKVRSDVLADLNRFRLPVKTYLLRDEAKALASKIPLDKFDVKVLRQIDNKHGLFLMGKDLAYNYYKYNGSMQVQIYKNGSEDGKDYAYLITAYIDIDTGEIEIPDFASDAQEEEVRMNENFTKETKVERRITDKTLDDAFTSKDFNQFIQMLLFVELSELRIDILQPNEKVGKTKSNKVINKSKSDIIVVTHKWNVLSIRTESFLVSGHWRIQPYGKNREKKKLIYIDTFEKEGYIRRNKSA